MTEYWNGGDGVTVESLHDEVVRIAAEQPEHIYESPNGGGCFYTHYSDEEPPKPGCIIGVAIFNLTGKLVKQDGSYPNELGGGINTWEWRNILGADAEDEWCAPMHSDPKRELTHKWLARVQQEQDFKETWSDAVAKADELHPLD